MLDHTLEFITLAASNYFAVFCFCNLIIAILLVGGSKPSLRFDQGEKQSSSTTPTLTIAENLNKRKRSIHPSGKAASSGDEMASSMRIDAIENEEEGMNLSPDGSEDDEQLRKRAEEFIERMNRIWRAEKMNTFYLAQS